jgi:hypothetical protein
MTAAKADTAAKAKADTAAKAKATVYKCPACGETYDSADVLCVGRPESGHANEPTPVEAFAGDTEADAAE